MYKFQKLLKDNGISENDQDLPVSIIRKIEKFKKIEASVQDADTDEVIEKRQSELDALDDQIMQTLPEYFDFEDEAELERQQAEKDAKQKEIDKQKIAEKVKAEKLAKEKAQKAKEEAEASAAAELQKPATTNHGALEKLFKQGKSTVTIADLKKAGFNTSWTGPIGFNGCKIKEFELYRDDQYSETFNLIKR